MRLVPWIVASAAIAASPAPVGPLPPEASILPSEGLLIGIDAKALFASSTWAQLASGQLAGLDSGAPSEQLEALRKDMREGVAKGLKDAEEKTGVRLDRDVDRAVMAVGGLKGKDPLIAIVAVGRFDRARVTAALQASQMALGNAITTRPVEGASLLVFEKAGKPDFAASLPDDRTLVMGTPAVVEQALANRAAGVNAIAAAPRLMALVKSLRPDAGLWLVADERALEQAKPPAGGAPPPFPIPQAVTVAAAFDDGLELAGEMGDEPAARNLADVIRGGLAIAKMQAAQPGPGAALPQKPLADVLSALSVEQAGRSVRVIAGGDDASIGMLAAVAIPSLLRARVSANEAAAIGDVRTVISAQAAYSSVNGGAYGAMQCLSDPKTCKPSYAGPTFVDTTLSSLADKSGYKRAFFPGRPIRTGARSYRSFAYTAVPLQAGQTGVRSFCGDSSGLVCSDPQGAPILPSAGACPSTCSPLQ